MNYSRVILFDGESLVITPSEADALERALGTERKFVKIGGTMIATSSVSRVEETTKPWHAEKRIGPSGKSDSQPLEGSFENSVKAQWVKKRVTSRAYDHEYAGLPGCRKLTEDGSDVWVAFTLVVTTQPLPDHLLTCEPAEIDRLERMITHDPA